jgi:hypothetical protein
MTDHLMMHTLQQSQRLPKAWSWLLKAAKQLGGSTHNPAVEVPGRRLLNILELNCVCLQAHPAQEETISSQATGHPQG